LQQEKFHFFSKATGGTKKEYKLNEEIKMQVSAPISKVPILFLKP
jgi:hypothetical protein